MKKNILALACGLMALPAVAAAQQPGYSYLEGGLAFYPSFGNQDYIGIDIRGSKALRQLHDDLFVFGGLKYLDDDFDLTALHVGGGFRFEVDQSTDFWAGITLEYQDYDIPRTCVPAGPGVQICSPGSIDDMAIGFRAGIRHMIAEGLEVGGSVRLVTGDLDYAGFTGTVRYPLQNNMSLLGEIDVYDGEPGLIGGLTIIF
jgi:hypothetical protein